MTRQTRGRDRLAGQGRGGAKDWIAVRLNSFALLALYAWLLTALILLPDLSYTGVRAWLRQPLNSVLMILLILTSFWHARYGLKEVIDDYVHRPFSQAVAIAALYAFTVFGAAYGVWSVARVALVPSP